MTVFLLGVPDYLDEDDERRIKKIKFFSQGIFPAVSLRFDIDLSDWFRFCKRCFIFFTRKSARHRQWCMLMLALAIPANRCPSFTSEHVRPNHVSTSSAVFF